MSLLLPEIPLAPVDIVKRQQFGPTVRLAVSIQQMDRANCPVERTRLERAAVRLSLETDLLNRRKIRASDRGATLSLRHRKAYRSFLL